MEVEKERPQEGIDSVDDIREGGGMSDMSWSRRFLKSLFGDNEEVGTKHLLMGAVLFHYAYSAWTIQQLRCSYLYFYFL